MIGGHQPILSSLVTDSKLDKAIIPLGSFFKTQFSMARILLLFNSIYACTKHTDMMQGAAAKAEAKTGHMALDEYSCK